MIRVTALLILLTIALWVVWDFYAFHRGGYEATETAAIRRWARQPLVPLAIGVLIGHLFACG